MNALKDKKNMSPLVNEQIRASNVQLITHEGENIGVVPREQALRMADEVELDLVMIAKQGGEDVPVVKIMDFGKALYEKKKKQTEAKKHQKVIQIKEIKMRPKIGEHDYQTKMRQAIQFLKEGKRLKITLFFRGRENIAKEERGTELFKRINETFKDQNLLSTLVQERDSKMGQFWSRVYYLKLGK